MFCPKCGQPQPADAVRFCSRCGCDLGAFKSPPAAGAGPPALAPAPEARGADAVQRKKDVTKGALLMFLFALFVAALTVDMPSSHSSRIVFLIIAWLALTLFINLGPMLRYFFGQDALSSAGERFLPARLFRRGRRGEALPTPQTQPVGALPRQSVITGELADVPSVTEHTTNLLNRP